MSCYILFQHRQIWTPYKASLIIVCRWSYERNMQQIEIKNTTPSQQVQNLIRKLWKQRQN